MFFNKDEKAVSPIVATLVLIVVAIIGAALVGSILQAFGTNVQGQANSGDTAAGTSGEITVAGSTTVYPASTLLAQAFMDQHPGVKITVGQGGSDAGIAGAEQGSIDVGASSKDVDVQSPAPAGHPTLQKFVIGGRGVVFIAGSSITQTAISQQAAYKMYDTAAAGQVAITANTTTATDINFGDVGAGTTTTIYQRADGSGTEETVAKWVAKTGYTGTNDFSTGAVPSLDASSAVGETGNAGVLQMVQSTPSSIGFVDFGYVDSTTKLGSAHILNICNDATGAVLYTPNSANILAALKVQKTGGTPTTYPKGLVGPLEYVTKGTPTNIEKSFIDFAMNPDSAQYFHNVGLYHCTEI